MKDYDLAELDVLDQYGKVFLVKERKNSQLYIKKYIDLSSVDVYLKLKEMVSENIPRIYVVEKMSDYFGTDCGMVLEEYIQGETIASYIEKGRRFSMRETAGYLYQVMKGLSNVHAKGIIHRDIKPSNLIITPENKVKIIDFGISRIKKDNVLKDTEIMGTPGYAAPEQFGFRQTDIHADHYAIGVLINVMRTGMFPHEKKCTGVLGKVVTRCTELNPKDRYISDKEIQRELYHIWHGTMWLYCQRWLLFSVAGAAVLFYMLYMTGILDRFGVQLQQKQSGLTDGSVIAISENTAEKETLEALVSEDSPITVYYEVNRVKLNQSGEKYKNGDGILKFTGGGNRDELEYQDEKYAYINTDIEKNAIEFQLLNTGDVTISNPKIIFEFDNLYVVGGSPIETGNGFSYSNHVRGMGGWRTVTWELENLELRTNEITGVYRLPLENSFIEKGETGKVTLTVMADNCKGRTFSVPIIVE